MLFRSTDADGDYDIFLLSKSINDNDITQLLVNRNGSYYENKVLNKQLSLIVGYDFNFFDFGDYDRDGDLDLVLLGTNVVKPSPTKSSYAYYAEYVGQALPVDWSFKIYTNLNNTFAPSGITIEAPLPKTRIHKLKWLDINNDGQLDIVVQQDNQIISILQKTNGDFKVTKEVEIFDAFSYSTFGDFNKDSKIDFVIGGRKTQFKCFYSNINNRNEAPAVPDRLKAVVVDDACVLSWEENGDDRTNKISLKYALELYKDNRLIFSNANFKDIPTEDYDNYFLSKKRAFNKLGDGLYHWRVASIDDNYQISNFSKPDTFRIALHPVISGRSTVCNYDTALYTVKPFHSNYSWEVIGGQILSKNNTGNELLVKWDKSGNNLVKITNTKYGIDTVFRVEVKYNPIPKIEYNFINNNTTNRTVQFRDSLPVSVSKYSWMFGDASNSIDSVATPIKTYPLAGSYNVTLKLDYTSLCSSTSTSKINLLDPVLIGPQNVCKGDAVEYTVEPAKFQYTWSIGNGMLLPQDSSSARATIVWNSVGSGSVVVRNTALNLMDSISIAINNVPTSKIFIPESLGTNAQIKFIDSVSSDVVRFDWDFGELNKTFSHSSPVVVFDQSGPHKITFTATNDKECKVTKSSNVTVTENLIPIEISNLITQNSDGFNDYLWIENIERFPENEVQLFTSWGKLVYKSTSYTNTFKPGSDGTEPLPSGSYFCIVTIGGSSKRFEQIITVF